jgi:hypothetical protein
MEDEEKFVVPKEYGEHILKTIEKESNVKINSVNSSDHYFIFEMGENTNYTFKVKGCKHWLFGMWFQRAYENEDDENAVLIPDTYKVTFFGNHEWNLDKFKPSASPFSITENIKASEFPSHPDYVNTEGIVLGRLPFFTYKAGEKINWIKSSNIGSYYYYFGNHSYKSGSPTLKYLKEWYFNTVIQKLHHFKENHLEYMGLLLLKTWFKIRYYKSFTPVIENKENIYPQYELFLIDEEKVDNEKLRKIYKFYISLNRYIDNSRIVFTDRMEDGNYSKRGFYLKEKENGTEEN